ncbi:TPR-like protein [Backusella circina FSU 941]|nr:TPR-like protein [Backusella circina FSU 941]
MENPKAKQSFDELDRARCNGEYLDFPTLTKRYEKYHPNESVLVFTARMEAEFVQLIRQVRYLAEEDQRKSETRKWGNRNLKTNAVSTFIYPEESDMIHQLDDPSNVAIQARLRPSQTQLILVRLLDVIQRQINSGQLESPDDWQAQFSKIILARIYFETGRFDKALEWLDHLALRLEDVESGYGLVLLVQARVMKGICFELSERLNEALESYLGALTVVEQHPTEQNSSLFYWIEEGLYRSILLQLRNKGPVKQTLKLMRTYVKFCSIWPSDWRPYKRWVIFRHYLRYLTRAYQKGVYVSAEDDTAKATLPLSPIRSNFNDTNTTNKTEALNETMQLVTLFRQLLSILVPRLNAKGHKMDLNHRTIELANLLVAAHETVGWGPTSYIKRKLQLFHRMRKFTFNSLCITRHIFHTLIRLGDLKEAQQALQTYIELLNVPDVFNADLDPETTVEAIQDKLNIIISESNASATNVLAELEYRIKKVLEPHDEQGEEDGMDSDSGSDEGLPSSPTIAARRPSMSTTRLPLHVKLTTLKKPSTGSIEPDTEFDVVRLLLSGISLYAQLLEGKHQEGVVVSDLAVGIMEESELRKKKASQWRALMVQCRRSRGIAYGLFASQCMDEEKRLDYQNEALASLKKATELDSRSWQTFYELGLQQALLKDMVSASSSIRRSIKLNGNFLPSWHLLSLVQSSRQFNALPRALQVMDAGLKESDLWHLKLSKRLEQEDELAMYDEAEYYMRLRMSQTYLLELLEGPDAVLDVYSELYQTYASIDKKFFNNNSNSVTGSSSTLMERPSSPVGFKSRRVSSLHAISESGNVSRPRSYSNRTYRSDSMKSESTPSLPLEEQEDEEELKKKKSEPSLEEEKETTKRHRRSLTLTRTLMNDPLISLPSSKKKDKEQKERERQEKRDQKEREKQEKKERKELEKSEKKNRKSSFLTIKPSFMSNDTESSSSKKESTNDAQTPTAATPTTTNNSTITSSTPNNIDENRWTMFNDSSLNISSPIGVSRRESLEYASYSSLNGSRADISSTAETKTLDQESKAAAEEPNIYYKSRKDRWKKLLIELWIMTSQTYARADRYEEALEALSETEQLVSNDADVWAQLASLVYRKDDEASAAIDALKKAMSIDHEHIKSHVLLATIYLDMGQIELAEGLLERVTKGLGWDQTEAWFLLGQIYRQQENIEDAKNSLLYALKLSDVNPIRSLEHLPRFV